MGAAPYAPTAEQKARADLSTQPGLSVLADASDEALLDAMVQLTHRIHVGEGRGSRHRPMTDAEVADLRTQRDLLRTEALRRMGGTR